MGVSLDLGVSFRKYLCKLSSQQKILIILFLSLTSALTRELPRPQDPVVHAVADGSGGVCPALCLLSPGRAGHAGRSLEQSLSAVLSKGTIMIISKANSILIFYTEAIVS